MGVAVAGVRGGGEQGDLHSLQALTIVPVSGDFFMLCIQGSNLLWESCLESVQIGSRNPRVYVRIGVLKNKKGLSSAKQTLT